MRKHAVVFLAALAGVFLLSACVSQSPSLQQIDRDVEAIRQLWKTYEQGINTSSADVWISIWDDNGIQFPADEPMYVGKKAIYASSVDIFPLLEMRMTISPQEITILGDYAYSSGSYVFDLAEKGSDEWMHIDGKFLTILRRQADGSWKIWRDCYNANPPAE